MRKIIHVCFVLGYTVVMNSTLIQIQTLSNHAVTSIPALTGGFLVALVIFVSLFLFSRYAGRGRFVALITSLYVGYATYIVFPFTKYLPITTATNILTSDIVLFLVLCIVAYSILQNVVISDFVSISALGLVVLSFLVTGFLLALAYQVFPVRNVYTFTPAINMFFAAKTYFFWWFIAPLVGLFVFAR